MKTFNSAPYYDDFDENDKFYRILFRPGFAVQARELTQLQTQIQHQIKRHGDHIFKEGAMVIPGQMSIRTNAPYIKIQATELNVANLAGSLITDETGLVAEIILGVPVEGTDPATLYLSYKTSSDDNVTQVFADNASLSIGTQSVTTVETEASGVGSIATIERGVYYVGGNFVLVEQQTIVLDKYTNRPTYRIGLTVNEQIITPEDNDILLDNAQGSYNYAAPGAHRYFIDLVLTKLSIDSTSDENFIELGQVSDGTILRHVRSTEYSVLEKTLARRTYDESGNYTVRPFNIEVREHRSNDRGQWKNSTVYQIGDIVTNGNKIYVARSSGTSLSTGTGPEHTSYPPQFEDIGTSTGIEWEYTTNPVFNRGVYQAEGRVTSIRVNSGGAGYTFPPAVAINGGNGIGATATAVISQGQVVEIIVTNTGSGYTSTPTVDITSGGGAGASATAHADFGVESKIAVALEAGKAYVQGYEIEKVATEYVAVDKARDDEQTIDAFIQTPVGNYVLVDNLNSLPPIDSFDIVTIYDRITGSGGRGTAVGAAVGTARVRSIEFDSGTIGLSSAIYKLFLFDINMVNGKNFSSNAKSFYFSRQSGGLVDPQVSFSADVNPTVVPINGSVTTYSSYPTKGASTTLTGIDTSFQTQLSVGDYISVAGNVVRVTAVNSQNQIVVNTSITVDGAPLGRNTATIQEPQNTSLVYALPNYAIKSVTDEDGFNQTIYYVTEYFGPTNATNESGNAVITLQTSGGNVFASGDSIDNYLLMYNDATDGGVPIRPNSITGAGTAQVKLILTGTTYVGKSFTAIATIKKTGIGRKSKVLTRTTKVFTTQSDATASTLNLGQADIYRIAYVKMKSGTWGAEGDDYSIDITDRYDFDDGQRETHYDLGKLILKGSFNPPSASIEVAFEYFTHSSGDYFTVDSYNLTKVAYNAIPSFGQVSLRDCIDFRPRINSAGTGFTGDGSSYSAVTKRGQDLTASFSYYLGRLHKIAIDFQGNFVNIPGVSSLTPGVPLDPALGMVLYTLNLEPYTFAANNDRVRVTTIDNKRYTMRDIGKLERRIDNLEYYTSLSLLEQETNNLLVQDAEGLDRFKRGFIVDNFTGHNVSNPFAPDYLCSIDMDNGILRPFYTMDSIPVVEKNTSTIERDESDYKLYGDVITLPLNPTTPHVVLAKQEYASRLENINPFAIFTFLGNISLTPSSDDWFEVQRRPDIIRNIEGNYNSMKIIAEKSGALGTVWNAWQNSWAGQSYVTNSQEFTTANANWGRSVWANALAESRGATFLDFNDFNTRFGGGSGVAPARQVVVQTVARDVGQSRTGVKTSIVQKIDTQVVDDRVVSTSVIPYMRARYLLVKVRGLKPNTRFYPYFDTMYVDYWSTPATYIEYTLPSPTAVDFDDSTNVGGNSTEPHRRIDFAKESLYGDTTGRTCLTVGDVIRQASSGLSAVVIGKDYNPETGVRRLHVVNIKSNSGQTSVAGDRYTTTPPYTIESFGRTFDTGTGTGRQIVGSISGATATVVAARGNKQHVQEPLVSNFNGDLNFLFYVPDYRNAGYAHSQAAGTFNNYQFRCGTREFKLVDATRYDAPYTSSARTTYSATGTLETKQATVNAVRNAELVQEIVSDNRVVVETSERVVSDTNWYDPLAQTFLVQSPGGAFLSKVDIFFATKDAAMPVTLEIREVVNGYPGKRILPFSKVSLKPEQVSISATTVPLVSFDGSTVNTPKYDTPTSFVFPSPVYVQDNQEYAIVLSSDSNNYKVWISQMGDIIPGSTRTISEQPYAGVFFKSQNASTWTADQTQDLKFTIWRANFDTNVTGTVQFVNEEVQPASLDMDPFQTAVGSNKIRVWHQNHGLYNGSTVTLDNVDPSSMDVPVTLATGTISALNTDATVTGVGTAFESEIGVGVTGKGAVLYTAAGTYIGVVDSVTSNTSLELKANAAATVTAGTSFEIKPSLNGIPVTEVYKKHTSLVSDVDLDSYCITVTTVATSTGYTGGNGVRASRNVNYDAIQPSMQIQTFTDTQADFFIQTTSGASVDGSEVPYQLGSMTPALVNENNFFYQPQTIASPDNAAFKTLTLNAEISSNNPALSPIIDTQRTSVVAISNKINKPLETNVNVAALDNISLFTGATGAFNFAGKVRSVPITNGGVNYTSATVSFSAPSIAGGVTATGTVVIGNGGVISAITITNAGSGYTTPPTMTFNGIGGTSATFGTVVLDITDIVSSNASVVPLMTTISVGKYITISGATTTGNNGTFLVTGNVNNGTLQIVTVSRTTNFTSEAAATGTAVVLRNLFIDEIAPFGGSVINKYISKVVTLEEKAEFLRVRFSANIPTQADVLVYYKTSPNGATLDLDTTNWILMSPDNIIPKVENGSGGFSDIDYSIDNIPAYDAVTVKLVMTSTNSSAIPQIRDLRIICCA